MAPRELPKILDWYGDVAARRVDLVSDYAGSELFFIHGESLLLRCFEEPGLDFRGGFQLLHSIYLVERILSNLKSRKCNFHLVFFDEAKELCIPANAGSDNRYKYLLARSVTIRHLENHLVPTSQHDLHVKRFQSILDTSFREYFSSSGAYFIMLHDGAVSSQTHVRISPDGMSNPILSEGEDDELHRKLRLRAMICSILKDGSNVALINGMVFHDTKVIVDILEGSRQRKHARHTDMPLPSYGELINTIPEMSGLSLSRSKQIQPTLLALSELVSDHKHATSMYPGSKLSARLLLSCLAFKQCATSPIDPKYAATYIAHLAALDKLPLSARRFKIESAQPVGRNFEAFLQDICFQIATFLDDDETYSLIRKETTCDIADLIDGRLLNILRTKGHAHVLSDPGMKQHYDFLANTFRTMGWRNLVLDEPLSKCDQTSLVDIEVADKISNVKVRDGILPFSNPVFDNHLLPIRISIASEQNHSVETGRIFQEITHWHSAKRPLSHKKSSIIEPKIKMRIDRRNQRYMRDMTRYAASLTNANGGLLNPETIILDKGTKATLKHQTSELAGEPEPIVRSNPKKPVKTPKKSNKEVRMAAINANNTRRQDELAKKLSVVWKELRAAFDKETDILEKYKKVSTYYSHLDSSKRELIGAEVQYHLICLLTERFLQTDSEPTSTGLRALLWDSLRRLASDKLLTTEIAAKLRPIIELLELPEIKVKDSEITRPLCYDPNLVIPHQDGQNSLIKGQTFQLLHCGPYFDRNLDSAPDPRVTFEPDKWQREVLDELDARRSLFVVAPTSAGKTFISFHAMKNVLRESDDGILVYVAPTKALVLQVAAEVQARFSKTFRHSGKSVWAVHTRDYRVNNPNNCQILVTVPQILQILLLSPSNARNWSPRIRYIIFDEIHSIGQAEDGVVWEQLLLLAPCPIIALSATVGNPETFSGWLADTQKALGNKLVTVSHPHRFNDLRKFLYNPPAQHRFRGLKRSDSFGLLGLDGLEGFDFLHPAASLVNRSRGLPPDLNLEARDCLTLYQAMIKHQTGKYPVDPKLSPERSLPPNIIRKIDIVAWEDRLKSLLQTWMSDVNSPFDHVIEELAPPDRTSGDDSAPTSPVDQEGHRIDPNDLQETTLPLLSKLHDRDALPAILFNYDRIACERICCALTSQLEKAEDDYKKTSESWKRRVERYEQRKAAVLAATLNKKENKKAKKKTKEGEENPKDDLDPNTTEVQTDFFDGFDPDAPVEGFHFANQKLLSDTELSEHLQTLSYMDLPLWLNAGLRRGIGVHHAGMNRKYRQIVEMLFRKGYLRVVVATGTLALGINMPCVTVVFSGDSVYLTALNYRQAAGRAGRRGFDLLGNVVFQGVTKEKACRLLSSRLPDLNGHFPVTTTLILRLFSLLHECDSPFSRRAIDALLSQPRLYLNGPSFKDQVLHHLRFSIEYLRRQSLLSSAGAPINFAGLTSHLYYTENSSFAFNALIKGGYFHDLCADIKTQESYVLRTMMLVLGHIFCRRVCRESDVEYQETVKRSTSIVFLPELPPSAAQILRMHNAETRQVFTNYVATFVSQHLAHKADCTLPLTGLEVGGTVQTAKLPSSLPPARIRSAFVALSGHGDDSIATISELCDTVRQGVFLEEAVIPYIQLHPEESKTPLNAYLYDFFQHGDTTALEKANHIRKADVWYYLNDFSMILATIVASLANFLKISETDISQEEIMGEGDLEDDRREEGGTSDSEMPQGGQEALNRLAAQKANTESTISSQRHSSPSKKTKIADSWDDDINEDEQDGDDSSDELTKNDQASAEIRSKAEIEAGFLKIYRAFVRLSSEFNEKYRKIFA